MTWRECYFTQSPSREGLNVELSKGMKKSPIRDMVEELPKEVEQQVQMPEIGVWLVVCAMGRKPVRLQWREGRNS